MNVLGSVKKDDELAQIPADMQVTYDAAMNYINGNKEKTLA